MTNQIIAEPLAGHVIGSFGNDFIIAEWRDPGGESGPQRPIAPLHVHHRDDEAWYVLEGTLCVRIADQDVLAPACSAVFVPRGTCHSYWNPHPEPVRYLLVMTSNIYSLIHEIHQLKDKTRSALCDLFTKHDSELLGA